MTWGVICVSDKNNNKKKRRGGEGEIPVTWCDGLFAAAADDATVVALALAAALWSVLWYPKGEHTLRVVITLEMPVVRQHSEGRPCRYPWATSAPSSPVSVSPGAPH